MNKTKILILIITGLSLIGLFGLWNRNNYPTPETSEIIEEKHYHKAYPDDQEFYETAYQFIKSDLELSNKNIVGGIIPHHLLAADLIADFYHNLENQNYDTIVLIGPNHFLTGKEKIITSNYDWETPYGILAADKEGISKLEISVDDEAMEGEHSINSQAAFIKKTFPNAEFIPIILRPSVDEGVASDLADKLSELARTKKILVLSSADFSHYKISEEAIADNQISKQVIQNFDFENIYNIAVDSPASIYTLLKYGAGYNSSFSLLADSNSALLSDQPELASTTSYLTGYFVGE